MHEHLHVRVGKHPREWGGVQAGGFVERIEHLRVNALGAIGVRHGHRDQAELGLVAALGHELGVDGHPSVLGGPLGYRCAHVSNVSAPARPG